MRQHLPATLCYASAVLGSPVVYSILFLMLIVIHWIAFTTHSWVMTQPSLGMVNKGRTPHSVTDTAIWPLHPSLQNMVYGCSLRTLLNTVIQEATANHLASESEVKPTDDYPCSDWKLSFYKCKNWVSEGKSDLSKVTMQDCGKAGILVYPQIYFTLHQ